MKPKHPNSVLALRQCRIAQAQRPFNARGATVVRCPRCLIVESHCCCQWARPQQSKLKFCLLMHPKEPLKPTNTGRLIAEILPSTEAFCWDRTDPDPTLLSLLADQQYQPYIVFPATYCEPQRVHHYPKAELGKTPLLILLDGTWKQARRMFQSDYLAKLPVLTIDPDIASRYQLRNAAHEHQLATAEVAAQALAIAGETDNAKVLDAYFQVFAKRYYAGKRQREATTDGACFDFLESSTFAENG